MANIFFSNRQKKVGAIEIDTFTSENHELSSNVTQYPVENGGDISDHITNNPDAFSGNAVVMPVKLINPDTTKNRAKDAYEELKRINDDKEVVTIVSGLRVYENMHLNSISIPRSSETGNSLVFDISATQIRIANSQTTTIPKSQLGGTTEDVNQAQNTADTGKGTSGQTQESDDDSFLAQAQSRVDETYGVIDGEG